MKSKIRPVNRWVILKPLAEVNEIKVENEKDFAQSFAALVNIDDKLTGVIKSQYAPYVVVDVPRDCKINLKKDMVVMVENNCVAEFLYGETKFYAITENHILGEVCEDKPKRQRTNKTNKKCICQNGCKLADCDKRYDY